MKITFVAPALSLTGGIRVIATYAEQLVKRGHEVFVVASPHDQPTLKHQIKSFALGKGWPSKNAVRSSPSHFDGRDVPLHILAESRPVNDADVPDADVVIATWWETAEWVAALSEQKGAKAYFVQHHEVFDYLDKNRVQATYRLPLHKITISKWLVDLIDSEYGERDVSLVINSIDTDQFNAPIRQKQQVPTVGLLYASAPWKGCDISFEALKLVAQEIPELRLVAFGTNQSLPAESFPFDVEYTSCPAQELIKDIYAKCDVWLSGSLSEGFCLPPLEAMACRCPVVATPVGGLVDLVEEGCNGYLVPINDPQGLAKRLIYILRQSEQDWKKMSDAAYARATSHTLDDAVDDFEAALEVAISRQKQRSYRLA